MRALKFTPQLAIDASTAPLVFKQSPFFRRDNSRGISMKITISLFDRAGQSLGQLTLAASTFLIDLETLRNIGAWRVGIHK